jgi:AcrR family transcriptional regulator
MSKSDALAEPDDRIKDGRRRRGAQSRAIVLSRAIEISSIEGLEGLTIGRLATDVGISKGNITVLFGDKEALQIATLDAAVEIFSAKVVAPMADVKEPSERLQAFCDNWFDYIEQRVFAGGCMLYGMSSEYRARPGKIQDRVNHHRNAWTKLLSAAASEAQRRGQIRHDIDVDQLVFELTSFQATASIAAALGDQPTFLRARRTSRERIADTIPGTKFKEGEMQ